MICVIPARYGSKRIPQKNIKPFHGKPMIAYAIQTALDSKLFSRVIVSTNDDETGRIAMEYGAEYHRRPSEYAGDEEHIGTVDVVWDALRNMVLPDIVTCALYPCTPLLRPVDLIAGFHHFIRGAASHQYVALSDTDDTDAGQFYWGLTDSWLNGYALVHEYCQRLVCDIELVDINTPEDWSLAEKLYGERYGY